MTDSAALPEPFTSPAFWICPVCRSGAAERVESCEGFIDIADHEEGETEDVDGRHEIVYRPEYVERLLTNAAAQAEEIRGLREDAERYRALSDAIGDELIEVYDLRTDDEPAQFIVGSLGLEALCWYLQGEQSPAPLPARPA